METFSIEDEIIVNSEENRQSEKEKTEKKKKRKYRLVEIFFKIKEIICSENGFEEIIMSVLRVIYDECKVFVRVFLIEG